MVDQETYGNLHTITRVGNIATRVDSKFLRGQMTTRIHFDGYFLPFHFLIHDAILCPLPDPLPFASGGDPLPFPTGGDPLPFPGVGVHRWAPGDCARHASESPYTPIKSETRNAVSATIL
jgi:hypothetical protein